MLASTLVLFISSHMSRLPVFGRGFQLPLEYSICTKVNFEASPIAESVLGEGDKIVATNKINEKVIDKLK